VMFSCYTVACQAARILSCSHSTVTYKAVRITIPRSATQWEILVFSYYNAACWAARILTFTRIIKLAHARHQESLHCSLLSNEKFSCLVCKVPPALGENCYTAACQAVRICITVRTGRCGSVAQRVGKVGPPVKTTPTHPVIWGDF
jgi:hypothetical protein